MCFVEQRLISDLWTVRIVMGGQNIPQGKSWLNIRLRVTNAIHVAKTREVDAPEDLMAQKQAVVERSDALVLCGSPVTHSFANSLYREMQSRQLLHINRSVDAEEPRTRI